jgi:hypothetical protein
MKETKQGNKIKQGSLQMEVFDLRKNTTRKRAVTVASGPRSVWRVEWQA